MRSTLWDTKVEEPIKVGLSVKYPDGTYVPVPVPAGLTAREYTEIIEKEMPLHRITGVTVYDAEGVPRSVAR